MCCEILPECEWPKVAREQDVKPHVSSRLQSALPYSQQEAGLTWQGKLVVPRKINLSSSCYGINPGWMEGFLVWCHSPHPARCQAPNKEET